MKFKFTLWKVIISIIAIILWIFIILSSNGVMMCKPCSNIPVCDNDYGRYFIIGTGCECQCQSFSEMLTSNLVNILIPFALVYIVWSLFQKKNKK